MRTLVVIPCFNEAQRLDVSACADFLRARTDVGLLFVNDGSSDGTLELLRGFEGQWPGRVRVFDQQPNGGKAEAVRNGILQAIDAGAHYVGYFDADLATPLNAVDAFVAKLDQHPDIDFVIGSRVALLGRDIDRKPMRHYAGRIFATAASVVLDLPVYDTQCGAKLLRVRPFLRQLFETPFGSRWIFDVELIARYLRRRGERKGIYELPLERWTDVGESKVKARDFVRAVGEMAGIYRVYQLPKRWHALLNIVTAPFLRYVGAGGFGTALHYATLALLVELFAFSPQAATLVGALAGAFVNYLLNYHFTFASKLSHAHALPRFLAVAAVSALVNVAGVWFATSSLGLHYFFAQLLCTGAVLVMGFVINKLWTFRARESAVITAAATPAAIAELPTAASVPAVAREEANAQSK